MNGFKTLAALLLLAGSSLALPQQANPAQFAEAAQEAISSSEYVYEQPVGIPEAAFASKSSESVTYDETSPYVSQHHQPVETIYRCK